MRPNTLLMGYKHDWHVSTPEAIKNYVSILQLVSNSIKTKRF